MGSIGLFALLLAYISISQEQCVIHQVKFHVVTRLEIYFWSQGAIWDE